MRKLSARFLQVQIRNLRQYILQKSRSLHIYQTFRRVWRENYFVQFVYYALLTDNFYTFCVSLQSIKGFIIYIKAEL